MRPDRFAKHQIKRLLNRLGYDLVNLRSRLEMPEFPVDFDQTDIDDFRAVCNYTMTPPERIYMLTRAVEHLEREEVPGAFLECGSWRGGCVMQMARTLLRLSNTARELWVFDLFDQPWPDRSEHDTTRGENLYKLTDLGLSKPADIQVPPEQVRKNIASTGYPKSNLHLVPGRVEETLPKNAPDEIALLRLDTDLYESTRHELEHLYPRLTSGGVLIIDDYGTWEGARKATDDFLATLEHPPLLFRTDYSCRMALKP